MAEKQSNALQIPIYLDNLNWVRHHMYLRALGVTHDRALLQGVVHRDFGDLAQTLYIANGPRMVPVTSEVLRRLDLTEEEAFREAMYNQSVRRGIPFSYHIEQTRFSVPGNLKVYTLRYQRIHTTDDESAAGTGTLLGTLYLQYFLSESPSGFWLFPFSRHEFAVMSLGCLDDPKLLEVFMCEYIEKRIASGEMKEEDRLSDYVHFFDGRTKKIICPDHKIKPIPAEETALTKQINAMIGSDKPEDNVPENVTTWAGKKILGDVMAVLCDVEDDLMLADITAGKISSVRAAKKAYDRYGILDVTNRIFLIKHDDGSYDMTVNLQLFPNMDGFDLRCALAGALLLTVPGTEGYDASWKANADKLNTLMPEKYLVEEHFRLHKNNYQDYKFFIQCQSCGFLRPAANKTVLKELSYQECPYCNRYGEIYAYNDREYGKSLAEQSGIMDSGDSCSEKTPICTILPGAGSVPEGQLTSVSASTKGGKGNI